MAKTSALSAAVAGLKARKTKPDDSAEGPKKFLSSYIPEDLHSRVKVIATLRKIRIQDILAELLSNYVDREEKKLREEKLRQEQKSA